MVVLNSKAIEAHLDPVKLKAAVANAFASLARGKAVQPPQTLVPLPAGSGDFIIYSAADLDCGLIGVKVSPYLVKRGETHDSPVTAYTLLMSLEDGEPVALYDSRALTTHRTAATTSIALDYLLGARTGTLAVIGAGPVARLHALYELQSRSWENVVVFSPSLASDPRRVESWKADMPARNISVAATIREAVADADAVMLCTSSGTPVIELDWLRDDVVVTSISTNAFEAHEINPASLTSMNVFCDLRSTAPLQAGDMIIAARDHAWNSSAIVADLPELTAGLHPGSREGRRFFRSIGLGIADVAAAVLARDCLSSGSRKFDPAGRESR